MKFRTEIDHYYFYHCGRFFYKIQILSVGVNFTIDNVYYFTCFCPNRKILVHLQKVSFLICHLSEFSGR